MQLHQSGRIEEAAALMGGFEAWKTKYLVEPTKAEEVTA
jgi:hypothetical protein